MSNLNLVYEDHVWTSDLKIYTDYRSDTLILDIKYELNYIEMKFSKFIPKSYANLVDINHSLDVFQDEANTRLSKRKLKKFVSYNKPDIDYTGVLKGLALYRISLLIPKRYSYIIDFGGDIAYNTTRMFIVSGWFGQKPVKGVGCVFTSENHSDSRRGLHIKSKTNITHCTVFSELNDPVYCDYLATNTIANGIPLIKSSKTNILVKRRKDET